MKKTFTTCRLSTNSRSGLCFFDCLNKETVCECNELGTTYVDEQSEIEKMDFQKKNQDSTSADNQIIDCRSHNLKNQEKFIICGSFKPRNRLLGDRINDNCFVKFLNGNFQLHRSRDVMPAIFWPSGEREDFESVNHHPELPAAPHGEVIVSKKKIRF